VFLFCIVHCLSASDTDEVPGAAALADSDEVDDDEQAATNPSEATTMNSPDSLFI
jgi:hypothetical protein